MPRYLQSVLCVLCVFLFCHAASAELLFHTDIGKVKRVIDAQFDSEWFRQTPEDLAPITFSWLLQNANNIDDVWEPKLPSFHLTLPPFDPATETHWQIDETNAAEHGLDWIGLKNYLLKDITNANTLAYQIQAIDTQQGA